MEKLDNQQPIHQQTDGLVTEDKEEKKQGLAIASFVLSLLGFSILGLIFGIIALKRKQLRRAALSGTIISAVKLVLGIFFFMGIFAGAILPRLSTAQQRARDVARKNDLQNIGTAIISYNANFNKLPETKNGCTKDFINILVGYGYLDSEIDDPLITPFQPGLFCNSDKLGYGYWTNGSNFVVSASIENPLGANLCKTDNKDYVTDFKNALNQNNVESARNILTNVSSSCTTTGASNLYYVILY